MPDKYNAYLSLGSNKGDRENNLLSNREDFFTRKSGTFGAVENLRVDSRGICTTTEFLELRLENLHDIGST